MIRIWLKDLALSRANIDVKKWCPHLRELDLNENRIRIINTKYHHFRDKVLDGTLQIQTISTTEMLANILTKITPRDIHIKMRKELMGW